METNAQYWNKFYKEFEMADQSSFAELVLGRVSRPDVILDLGCGNGRDSLYFLRVTEADVLALDASKVAIEAVALRAEKTNLSNRIAAHQFDFESQSLGDLNAVVIDHPLTDKKLLIYARFLIHALTEAGEDGFWRLIEDTLAKSPGSLYLALEYRTPRDEGLPKQTPTHFRRYVEPCVLRRKAEKLGLSVLIDQEGSGFSVFGADDAFLSRQIFQISST